MHRNRNMCLLLTSPTRLLICVDKGCQQHNYVQDAEARWVQGMMCSIELYSYFLRINFTFIKVIGTQGASQHSLETGVILTTENGFGNLLVHCGGMALSLSKNHLQSYNYSEIKVS